MPFDFSVEHGRRRAAIIARDPLSVDDALAVLDRQAAQGWTYALLHDARETQWVPTSAEVVRISRYIRAISHRLSRPCGPLAVIASSAALIDLTRVYSRLGADDHMLKIQVFSDRAKAEDWLDEMQSQEDDAT